MDAQGRMRALGKKIMESDKKRRQADEDRYLKSLDRTPVEEPTPSEDKQDTDENLLAEEDTDTVVDDEPTEPETPSVEDLGFDLPGSDNNPSDLIPAQENDVRYWKEKYLAIKGKFDTENPRLKRRNKELENQVADLQSQIEELNSRLKGNKPLSIMDLIPEEERSEIETQLGQKGSQAFFAAYDKMASILEKKVLKETDQLKRENYDAAYRSFYAKFSSQVPDCQKINKHKLFTPWLKATTSRETGEKYADLLNRALKSLNVESCVVIYNNFKEYLEKRENKNPAVEVEPGVNGTSVTTTSPKGGQKSRIVTAEEVARASRDYLTDRSSKEKRERYERLQKAFDNQRRAMAPPSAQTKAVRA